MQEQRVKLFRTGSNQAQALPIPREFELPGDDAVIRKEGERLIIEPALAKSLLEVLAKLTPLDDDFPVISELPSSPVEL